MNDVHQIAGSWTSRDLDILETLALKVRFLTLSQIASIWWKSGHRNHLVPRRRLLELSKAGLLARYSISAHPMLQLDAPAWSWSPGMPAPDHSAVAYQLQSRWTEAPIACCVYAASRMTANLFASFSGKLPPPIMWTHDLHVGEIYRQYRLSRPHEAQAWLGEDALGKAGHGVKDPDAILRGDDGSIRRVIDFGGRYDAERVLDFHLHYSDRKLEYELW